jgi:hypothetical protein
MEVLIVACWSIWLIKNEKSLDRSVQHLPDEKQDSFMTYHIFNIESMQKKQRRIIGVDKGLTLIGSLKDGILYMCN